MSRHLDGAHTHHSHIGGVGLVAVIVLVLAVVSKVAHAVGQAADTAVHVLAVVLEVVIIGLAVLVAVAATAGLTWAGVRLYRWNARRRPLAAPAAVRAEVVPSSPLAIEAPKPRLTGLPAMNQEVGSDKTS